MSKKKVSINVDDSAPSTRGTLHLTNYGQESSIHGFAYICSPATSCSRRIFWIALLMVAFGYCTWSIVDTVQKFFHYDSYVSAKIITNTELTYPAITICNTHNFDQESLLQVKAEMMFAPQDQSTIKMKDYIERTSYSLNETIPFCFKVVNSDLQNIFCNDSTKAFDSVEYGRCYTFNYHLDDEKALKVRGVGRDEDIILLLDGHYDTGYAAVDSRSAAGFRIVVHSPDEFPDFQQNSVYLHPGTWNSIGLRRRIETKLGKKYNNVGCLKEENDHSDLPVEAMENFDLPYSDSLCEYDCYVQHLFKDINCSVYDADDKACSVHDDKVAKLPPPRGSIPPDCSYCLRMCERVVYDTRISSADFYHNEERKSVFSGLYQIFFRKPFIKSNMVAIEFYYESLDVTTYEQIPAVSYTDLYSNIGGIFGLFIGASLVSFAESFDFFMRFCAARVKECRRRRSETDKTWPHVEEAVVIGEKSRF